MLAIQEVIIEDRMPAPLSNDLRERIIKQVERGLSHDAVAENLDVSQSAVSSIVSYYRKHGHINPIKPVGNTPTYNEEDYPIIRAIVLEQPDKTLLEYSELIVKKTKKPMMSPPPPFAACSKNSIFGEKRKVSMLESVTGLMLKKRDDYTRALEEMLMSGEFN